MANKKFTDLPTASVGSLAGTDILAVTKDPNGTPVSNQATITALMALAPVQQSDITPLATQVSLGNAESSLTALINLRATQVSLGNHEALTTAHGISAFGATLVDDADAATARTTLDVDQAGTDNSTDVTLATVANNYLSLSGQEITAGIVPVSLGGTGSGDLATARANLGLGTAATTASTDYATAAHTHAIDDLSDVDTSSVAPADGQALVWDNTNSQWEPGPAGASTLSDLSDVTITSASNEDVIKFNGTSFVNGQVSVDVDTPLNTALRGTDNPHIGAYPNQSFKVTDNPYKSVMVIADADGNLEFVTKDGANIFVNTPSSRLALAKGFSIQADGAEPDIEAVDTDGTTYSVISGDTDTKGANGLPIRQGFNYPDIGAYPAPLLISGGSIA